MEIIKTNSKKEIFNKYMTFCNTEVINSSSNLGQYYENITGQKTIFNDLKCYVSVPVNDILYKKNHKAELFFPETLTIEKKDEGSFDFLNILKEYVKNKIRDDYNNLEKLSGIELSYSGFQNWNAKDITQNIKQSNELKEYIKITKKRKELFDKAFSLNINPDSISRLVEIESMEDEVVFRAKDDITEEELVMLELKKIFEKEITEPVIYFKNNTKAHHVFIEEEKVMQAYNGNWLFGFNSSVDESKEKLKTLTKKILEYNNNKEVIKEELEDCIKNEEYEKCTILKNKLKNK